MDEPVRLSTRTDGTLRVELRGEVAFATADTLRESIRDAVDRARPALVLMDLSKVTFMDSSGMHILAAADARARRSDTRLVIAHPTPSVRRLLELTGMNEVLQIVDGSGPSVP